MMISREIAIIIINSSRHRPWQIKIRTVVQHYPIKDPTVRMKAEMNTKSLTGLKRDRLTQTLT